MNPITATVIDHEPVEFLFDGVTIPVVVGWNDDGSYQTARGLAQRKLIDPSACDHAGATWSSNLVMRCPKCGSSMFLPPKLLKYLPAATISAMDLLWSAAGWAEWHDSGWYILPEHWTIEEHPLFAHCGGLALRNDRRAQYFDAMENLAEAGDDVR
jgi:hypothetical protein